MSKDRKFSPEPGWLMDDLRWAGEFPLCHRTYVTLTHRIKEE